MPWHSPTPTACSSAPRSHWRLSFPDALVVVVVVVIVVAAALTVSGLPPETVLGIVGGAALVGTAAVSPRPVLAVRLPIPVRG